MIHSALQNDLATSKSYHYELLKITRWFFEQGNPGGVKAALETLELMESHMRLPLLPISKELNNRIKIETNRIKTL